MAIYVCPSLSKDYAHFGMSMFFSVLGICSLFGGSIELRTLALKTTLGLDCGLKPLPALLHWIDDLTLKTSAPSSVNEESYLRHWAFSDMRLS